MREWLKTLRTENGLTMKDVSEQLHISESYYCAIENGDRQKKMDITVASGLAMVLGVPVTRIIELDNPQPTT